ncbi:beta-N-acetylhexosaminidase [Microbacterium keratanolyticum]|uniref:beta-N-acetylhexosaminidase n=1 Tax=Microbacterium keratanolyticum TaxID=67574 RepID=UPI0036723104
MAFPESLPLIPFPTSVRRAEGALALTSARVHGPDDAVAALREGFAARTSLPFDSAASADDAQIVLQVGSTSAGTPESYELRVGDRVEITGADEAGLFYGVQTLRQLAHEVDGAWSVPHIEIDDAPRFAYRGIMLDVARHFFGVDDVKRYIDNASALKYNHLHLHLTDDQGWRLQIDAWPLLTEKAASSSALGDEGGFYTKDDYREIVRYAASKHMVLVPEVDLPGHTHAIGVAYPELVEAPVISDLLISEGERLNQPLPVAGQVYTGWGVGHSSVRIGEERTYDFVRDVLTEIAEITPGPYLHIGGDESLGTTAEDFATFVTRATRIAAETGKTPVAWHEVGAVSDIAEGTIGQYWGKVTPEGSHAEEAAHFVARGGSLIMSASDATYLDMKYDADFPLGLVWAAIINVQKAYEWEPTAVVPGVPTEAILGIEAPLWSETTRTMADVEQLVFPRAAAHAETAWSAATAPERTWDSFRARVAGLAPAWKAEGVNFYASEEIPWQN